MTTEVYKDATGSEYSVGLESMMDSIKEMLPLYLTQYKEMADRLKEVGVDLPGFRPRLDEYFKAGLDQRLLLFVVRKENSQPVGYCIMYLTHDMHNGEFIAVEDTIYVMPDYRKGIGRKLSQHVLNVLRELGVKRLNITVATDIRAGKLFQRMGFKPVAQSMTYTFED